MSQPMNPNVGMHGGMMPNNPQMMANNPNPAVGGGGMHGVGVPGPNMAPVANPNPQPINAQPQVQSSSSHPSSGGSSQQQQHQDSISRVKYLVAQLKKALQELIEVAASNIIHNSNIDNGQLQGKSAEDQVPRFEKALEDFYSICNQIELCLRTILECAIQTRDSTSYLPFQISKETHSQLDLMPPNLMPDSHINYTQYLSLIKKQVNYAKAVYEILSDSVRQLKQSDQPPQPPNIMQQQQAPPMNAAVVGAPMQSQHQQSNMS